MKYYSPYQFAFFRIILGAYLCFHFVHLLPYAAEVWSNQGILPEPNLNLTHGVFPNILSILDAPLSVTIFVGILAIFSFLFMIGFQRNIIAVLLWYGWVCLFDRNNLINNPGIPYVGWILLCCAAIPKGEALSFSKTKDDERWEFPVIIFVGAWILMAVGYTISGFDKFQSPSWRDGTAIYHLLENPLARDWWLREMFLSLPESIIKLKTWGVLSLEILFLPLALIKWTRKWVWLAMIFMHLGILMIVDFADLTLGMLMIHWFTFDARWLSPNVKQSGLVFFDGVCGMCNGLVNFLMKEDLDHTLQFAALQGETSTEHLTEEERTNMSTIVFKQGDTIYKHSDAILKTFASMGGVWKLFLILRIIPKFIRDRIYKWIATNRYKWFGKKDACRMPTPEERGKLLA